MTVGSLLGKLGHSLGLVVRCEAEGAEPAAAVFKEGSDGSDALKQAIVDDIVSKIVGEEDENLEVLVQPEIVTAPYDPRFPNTNQARHCFVRYCEYHKCVVERGEDNERCKFYQRCYESLCPADWLEEWQDMRDSGTWFGKY